MAGGNEGAYKALWELAWAGKVSWGEILPHAEARCAAARVAGDLRAEAEELAELSFLLDQVGRAQEGVAAQRRELKLYRRIGDGLDVARTLGGLGDALKKLGRLHSAIRCWRQAMAWFFHSGDPLATFHALVRIGEILKLAGRRLEAGHTFRLALSIAPENHGGWQPGRVLHELAELETRG